MLRKINVIAQCCIVFVSFSRHCLNSMPRVSPLELHIDVPVVPTPRARNIQACALQNLPFNRVRNIQARPTYGPPKTFNESIIMGCLCGLESNKARAAYQCIRCFCNETQQNRIAIILGKMMNLDKPTKLCALYFMPVISRNAFSDLTRELFNTKTSYDTRFTATDSEIGSNIDVLYQLIYHTGKEYIAHIKGQNAHLHRHICAISKKVAHKHHTKIAFYKISMYLILLQGIAYNTLGAYHATLLPVIFKGNPALLRDMIKLLSTVGTAATQQWVKVCIPPSYYNI